MAKKGFLPPPLTPRPVSFFHKIFILPYSILTLVFYSSDSAPKIFPFDTCSDQACLGELKLNSLNSQDVMKLEETT